VFRRRKERESSRFRTLRISADRLLPRRAIAAGSRLTSRLRGLVQQRERRVPFLQEVQVVAYLQAAFTQGGIRAPTLRSAAGVNGIPLPLQLPLPQEQNLVAHGLVRRELATERHGTVLDFGQQPGQVPRFRLVRLHTLPQGCAGLSRLDAARDELSTRVIPQMAQGGIVRQPTIAMIGERGPEAVIPLSRMSQPAMQPVLRVGIGELYVELQRYGRENGLQLG
jgi:hypothetical protein